MAAQHSDGSPSGSRYWGNWFDLESWTPPQYDLQEGDLASFSTLFNTQYAHINFGIKIGAKEGFSKNPDKRFIPASNMKLITAHAALKKLGTEFRFETKVEFLWKDTETVYDLRIFGDGDPSWGMSEFGENLRTRVDWIAQELWNRGVRKIEGDIELVDSDPRFRGGLFPPGWGSEDVGECYGAMAFAFNMNINCAFFKITGLQTGYWVEEGVEYPVQMKLRSGNVNAIKATLNSNVPPYFSQYIIEGTYKSGSTPELLLAIYNPNRWVKNLLVNAVKRKGIQYLVRNPNLYQNEYSSVESESHRSAKKGDGFNYQSRPLRELIVPMLKLSLNHSADALYRSLASRFSSQELSLNDGGAKVVFDIWNQENLIGPGELPSFADGSGLSRNNWVQPSQLYRLLEVLLEKLPEENPILTSLWNGLPIAGVDGTLKNRMRGTSAEGALRGKTGTLTGVYALSGYVPDSLSGQLFPYVMIANTPSQYRGDAITAMDRAAVLMAEKR